MKGYLTIYRGAYLEEPIKFINTCTNEAFDISNFDLVYAIKEVDDKSINDAGAVISGTISKTSHQSPTTGQTQFELTTAQTNLLDFNKFYKMDFRLIDSSNKPVVTEAIEIRVKNAITYGI